MNRAACRRDTSVSEHRSRGNQMRGLSVIAAAVLAASAAQASDGLSPAQEIQVLQSGLAILGYEPGAIDGRIGPQTRAAIAAFGTANGIAVGGTEVSAALLDAVQAAMEPVLIARLGGDPTGIWDLDWSASGLGPDAASGARCRSDWVFVIADGVVWRNRLADWPLVMALVGDGLEVQTPPGGDFVEPYAFEFVDANTMRRSVEGTTEIWVRCGET
ncbi:MAG: peptidoglycan-binding domain-containing protein [Alphaproteobacteria bacterium]